MLEKKEIVYIKSLNINKEESQTISCELVLGTLKQKHEGVS